MKRIEPEVIDYYNSEVVQMIIDKYGYNPMDECSKNCYVEKPMMLEHEDYG